MALKVKAQEKLQKIGTHAGKYRYIMMPELYTSLSQEKVIKEAALLNQPLSPTPARGFLLFSAEIVQRIKKICIFAEKK